MADLEQRLRERKAAFEDPAIVSDATRLLAAQADMQSAQEELDTLYARWAELEAKAGTLSR